MSQSKYKYALFDLDGTLTDPGEGITKSVQYALDKFGIHVEDRKQLFCFIGPPLHESFEVYYGFSRPDAMKAVDYYREYYAVKGIFENLVYDGIPEVLAKLRDSGVGICLATSKPEVFAKQILEHFGLDGYFTAVAGSEMDGTRTKKAEVVERALGLLGNPDAGDCVMIGDREHDVLGGAAHGLDTIGVLFGYGSREELEHAGATYIAAKPIDIVNIINQ
ncbi:MAG: HAD family hydrolase [Ruminococcaceae bacterium]|nr:HAD family hydrolase [Oscillospiraceae bacterium]